MPKAARPIISIFICCACLFLILAGCEDKSPPSVKPKVVAKKIQPGGDSVQTIAEKKIEKKPAASNEPQKEAGKSGPKKIEMPSGPREPDNPIEGRRVVAKKITPPQARQETVADAQKPDEAGKPKKIGAKEKPQPMEGLTDQGQAGGKIAGGKIGPEMTTATDTPTVVQPDKEKTAGSKEKTVPPEETAGAVAPVTPPEKKQIDKAERKKEPETAKPDKIATLAPGPKPNSLAEKLSTEKTPFYDPRGKIDPFMPLFKDEPNEKGESEGEVALESKKERKKRVPRTPLERLDLSQLDLVGIIRAPGGNKALVEEASGKGYIVSVGTYMGTNGGRVVDITKDRVIVEEEVEDILGKLTMQKREMKIQKPFGEN